LIQNSTETWDKIEKIIVKNAENCAKVKCFYLEYVEDMTQEYLIQAFKASKKVDTSRSEQDIIRYCSLAGLRAIIKKNKKIQKNKKREIAGLY
jgi:hypothetical protein